MNIELSKKATELTLDYFKKQDHVNIYWHNGSRWILVCQSSGKHFMADIELLKIENNGGRYKISDSQLEAVL